MSAEKGTNQVPHDAALFLSILVVTSVVVGSATWLYLNPRPTEQFFALGILGEGMMAEHYYPGDDPNVGLGDVVKWHVTLYNHMGSVQYVSVRVKLLNRTTPPPDDLNHAASPVPSFAEIDRVLVDNETWTFPLYWSVLNATEINGTVRITKLRLNNVTFDRGLDTTAQHGYNFRMVLELWTYDEQEGGFQFGWESGGEARSAWVQIWFNLTLPTPRLEMEGANHCSFAPSSFQSSPARGHELVSIASNARTEFRRAPIGKFLQGQAFRDEPTGTPISSRCHDPLGPQKSRFQTRYGSSSMPTTFLATRPTFSASSSFSTSFLGSVSLPVFV